jgi:ABC-type amino acid transport substrate-binding protein
MTIPAARVLAFPGIDLDTLTKLRTRACDAFMSDDLTAYQDACMMMRKLLGGRDVSETGARSYRYRDDSPRHRPVSQEVRDRLSAKHIVL